MKGIIKGNLYPRGMPRETEIDKSIRKISEYADLCTDWVEIVETTGSSTEDVKIAILKMAGEGKVVRGVGLKISDSKFAVYRENGEKRV